MASQWNDASEPLGTPPAPSDTSPPPPPSAPPPGDNYPVTLNVRYPEPGELNRFLLFVKWLLIIPHTFVLFFLSIGMVFATFCAWWAILFTGRYPRGLFDLVVGIQQWSVRANAYSTLLVTDEYPPFSIGRPLTSGAIAVLVVGVLLVLAFMALYVLLILVALAGITDGFENGRQFATPRPGGFR